MAARRNGIGSGAPAPVGSRPPRAGMIAALVLFVLAPCSRGAAASAAPERLPFHVAEAVGAVRRSFSALNDTHPVALGKAVDVIVLPKRGELHMQYYHVLARASVRELLGGDACFLTIGYEKGFGHDAAAKEISVRRSAHPVLRFHFATDAAPRRNARRLEPSSIVLLPAAEQYVWVPPDRRGGEHFLSLQQAFTEPAAALPVRSLAFHAAAKLATQWQDAQIWVDLFLFFNFCSRELLLVSLREDEWYSFNPTLDWAVQTEPLSYWIHGSGKIEAKYQFGSMPLHRAAGAKDPRLLRQVLATDPDLELEDQRTGGTALHAAAAAGDAVACETLRRAGASAKAKDDLGRRPVDVAQSDSARICLGKK